MYTHNIGHVTASGLVRNNYNAQTRVKSIKNANAKKTRATKTWFRTCIFALSLSQLALFNSPLIAQTVNIGPPLDAAGWTAFTPSSDSRIVYVSSSSGSDTNNGLSGSAPVQTIRHATSLLRTGYPDWLLLKKGDTWTLTTNGDQFNSSGYPGSFCLSGRSATEPMLVSSYGTGKRPLLQSDLPQGSGGGSFAVLAQPAFSSWCAADYFAVVGLEFYQYKRDPANASYDPSAWQGGALSFLEPTNWWLVEDCKFSYYGLAIDVGGGPNNLDGITHKNANVRRNVSAFQYANSASGFATGFHFENVGTLLGEENISYHDGWLNDGNPDLVVGPRTIYNHGFYLQGNPSAVSTVIRGNVIISASWAGIQQRPGGLTTDNFLEKNGVGITSGNSASTISNNVVLNSQGANGQAGIYAPGGPGWGIHIYLSGAPMVASGNVVAHVLTATDTMGIAFDGVFAKTGGSAINNIVFDWATPFYDSGIGTTSTADIFEATNSNTYNFPNPGRNAETYDSEVMGGPGTMTHFASLLLAQSKDTWNTKLTANALNSYVRAGFGISGTVSTASGGTSVLIEPPLTSTGTTSGSTSSTSTASSPVPTDTTSTSAPVTTSTGTTSTGTTSTGTTSTGTTSTGTTSTGTASTGTASTGTASLSPPKVALASPANGTVLKGNSGLNIAVSVSDVSSIAAINIYLDGSPYFVCRNTSVCSASISGKKLSQGTHLISATATDSAGLTGKAAATVTALR